MEKHIKKSTVKIQLIALFWSIILISPVFAASGNTIRIDSVEPLVIDFNHCQQNVNSECVLEVHGQNFARQMDATAQLFINDAPTTRQIWSFEFINRNHVLVHVPLIEEDAFVKFVINKGQRRSNIVTFNIIGVEVDVCGDGVISGDEQCDDGAHNGEPNHCNMECSGTTASVCGNDVLEEGEQCDDGNLESGDGCSESCVIEFCGDETINNNEVCDGQEQSCVTDDGYSGTQVCNDMCTGFGECVSTDYCGDGQINGNESCDDGADNGTPNHCDSQCSGVTPPVCGNGALEEGEQCDDGNTSDGDGCSANCVVEYCGDGIINNGEVCDGGGSSCVADGGYPGTQTCNAQCLGYTPCTTTFFCGDGYVNGNEGCDDGNSLSGDGCSDRCAVEFCGDAICNNGESSLTCVNDCPAVCGNGIIEPGEECDDGNMQNIDGCSDTCHRERREKQSGGSGEPSENDILAVMEVQGPASVDFFFHGTLPVPKGTFFKDNPTQPFKILQPDQTLAKTQTQVVSWYPNAEQDGAAVVEVMANVRRLNGTAGSMIDFPVVYSPSPTPEKAPDGASAADVLKHGIELSDRVKALLRPGNLIVKTDDVFHNIYQLDLLAGSPVRYKEGNVSNQVMTFNLARPIYPDSWGALNHLFGVHAFIQVVEHSDLVMLDLVFSNAQCNLGNSDQFNGASNNMVFGKDNGIEFIIPDGWKFHGFADPNFDPENSKIVKPFPDGKVQIMPQGAHFERRLILAPDDKTTLAEARLNRYGQAFSKESFDADGNHRWSWWNPETGNYYQHMTVLPHLDHLGATAEEAKANIRAEIKSKSDWLKGIIQSGQSTNNAPPVPYGVCGWHQSYGQNGNGYNPGGDEIHGLEGAYPAYASSRHGLIELDLINRMRGNRQVNFLFKNNGQPVEKIDVDTVTCGSPAKTAQALEIRFDNLKPANPGNVSPCYFNAGQTQLHYDYAWGNGLLPSCMGNMTDMPPLQASHDIRWKRTLYPLGYLANDSMAKLIIEQQASVQEMAATELPGREWNGECKDLLGSMYGKRQFADQYPHRGQELTRIDGWRSLQMTGAYSLAQDPVEREKRLGWFETYADILRDSQVRASGVFCSTDDDNNEMPDNDNNGQPDYLSTLYFQETYVSQGLYTILKSVFEDVDPVKSEEIRRTLLNSTIVSTRDDFYVNGNLAWRFGTVANPQDGSVPNESQMFGPGNMPEEALVNPTSMTQLIAPTQFGQGMLLDESADLYLNYAAYMLGTEDLMQAAQGRLHMNHGGVYTEWIFYKAVLEQYYNNNF